MIIFANCRLIDGTSDTVREGMHVLVEGNAIREVSDVPITAEGAQVIDLAGKTLMPGLIDAHVHVYSIHLNSDRERGMPHTLMMAHAIHRVRAMLMRGFTTVRDVAGGDWGMKTAIDIGLVEGPRLFVSGRALSQTGGHGDHRHITDESVPCACTSALDIMTRLADCPEEVRHKAREELRKGADHLKIMVSGGVGSPSDALENTQYQMDEIRAAVLEAEARGTYVAAHSYTSKATRRALEGGVRTIEHANFIDVETARLARDKGAFIVPTLICYRESADNADTYGLRPEVKQKLAEVNEAGTNMLQVCSEAGATMGFGTDLMGEMIEAQSKEFALRANVLKPMDIIKSATSVNAEILQQTGRLGCVATGAMADLLVIDGDPVERIELLEPRYGAIQAIMKNGRFHKQALD
ncbi:metal-dependent hydrolase family protein [Novosphingobium aquimarinum]|uniref:metal-dependent hydrolase family protein n=1 Tax=Novosphingobium aquimarinum TaxID=2682494 RepID=UPI0012ECB814|nr:amidohydrolase family protein [Novosphingobium aquimarinum]